MYESGEIDMTGVGSYSADRFLDPGEPLNAEVEAVWRAKTGLTIRELYGQTETGILAGSMLPLPVRPGSMGKPITGYDVAVIDEDGHDLPPDVEGYIAVRIRPVRPHGHA